MFRTIIFLCFMCMCNQAFGYKQFYEAFLFSKTSVVHLDTAKIQKTKCFLCHEGKSKKTRNHYGKLLEQRLTSKDTRNNNKIEKVFSEVELELSSQGITYKELFNKGTLPNE